MEKEVETNSSQNNTVKSPIYKKLIGQKSN